MSLKKIMMKGSTRLSLHDRFTFLRSQPDQEPSVSHSTNSQSFRQGLFNRHQQASEKNRRLAQVMDRRPAVIAALRINNKVLKQRLGTKRPGLSVKDRLTLRGRGRSLRGRLGQRQQTGRSPLTRPSYRQQQSYRGRGRSQSTSNLMRSQSAQSLNGRSRSYNRPQFRGRGRGLRRGIEDSYNRGRDDFRGRRGAPNYRSTRGQRSRGFRGQGGGRGRGRGFRGPPPTKEELDSQLDQYMSKSRHELDRELDTYMSNQESWD